jgi:DNA-binding NtrC family response regulator
MHTLTDDAQAALRAHAWPGNVRELRATMRRVAVLADSKLVRAIDLGIAGGATPPVRTATASSAADDAGLRSLIDGAISGPLQPLATLRDEVVKRYVELAIAKSGDDREAAAKALEIGVRTLYRYIS